MRLASASAATRAASASAMRLASASAATRATSAGSAAGTTTGTANLNSPTLAPLLQPATLVKSLPAASTIVTRASAPAPGLIAIPVAINTTGSALLRGAPVIVTAILIPASALIAITVPAAWLILPNAPVSWS